MRTWKILATAIFAALPAGAGIITTIQGGTSQVDIGGSTVITNSDTDTDGRVSVFAISGTQTTPEARTAARSSASGEMAANARIDDKNRFSRTDFSLVLSQADYSIQLAPDNVFVRQAIIDFVLPPSYLEITSNGELPNNILNASFLADLRFCLAAVCTSGDSVFHIQANLQASHSHESHSVSATGDAQLDLTALRNPLLTDTGSGSFLRTYNVGFPTFYGHLDLGTIPTGAPATVEYVMQSRAWGILAANIAISSVNDPFLLDTDPVRQFTSVTLTAPNVSASDAPEPGGLIPSVLAVAFMLNRLRARPRPRPHVNS